MGTHPVHVISRQGLSIPSNSPQHTGVCVFAGRMIIGGWGVKVGGLGGISFLTQNRFDERLEVHKMVQLRQNRQQQNRIRCKLKQTRGLQIILNHLKSSNTPNICKHETTQIWCASHRENGHPSGTPEPYFLVSTQTGCRQKLVCHAGLFTHSAAAAVPPSGHRHRLNKGAPGRGDQPGSWERRLVAAAAGVPVIARSRRQRAQQRALAGC